jgi:PTH1 family peptidyl-tRNA hydrolase
MNKSGEAVKKLSVKYQQPDTNFLYVIHDDLDIPIGKFKIQKGTGPKVHNGLSSINDHLHTEDYWRIRIGVENRDPTNRIPGEDYVLHDFTYDEQKILDELFPQILQRLQENIRVNK